MQDIYFFFKTNIIIVYFIYGLVFFMMGFAIALQNVRISSLRLAESFYYLSAFGIIHGLSEWGHVFIPIMGIYSSEKTMELLYLIEINLIALSFVYLLYFGLKLLSDTLAIPRWVLWIPRTAAVFWVATFILFPHLSGQKDIHHWYLLGDIFSRYAFALPGSLLSAVAFWRQQDDLSSLGQPQVIRQLRVISVMFLLYALFAGLFVPYAPFFPASLLNIQNLFRLTGFPVAVYRAAICSVIAYFVIRLTEIFYYESRKKLTETQRDFAILRERQRIRRDLHDGILQSIYAVGLGLETARQIATTQPEKTAEIITMENNRLDTINNEIRNYIMDMQQSTFSDRSLKEIIVGMVEEFKIRSGLTVDLTITDSHHECLSGSVKEQISLIVQELLSNIIKHSQANQISVYLSFSPELLKLVIADNGRGFQTSKPRSGLQNVYERAEQLSASLNLASKKNRGTRIELTIPFDSSQC